MERSRSWAITGLYLKSRSSFAVISLSSFSTMLRGTPTRPIGDLLQYRSFSAYFLFLQKKNVTGAQGGNRSTLVAIVAPRYDPGPLSFRRPPCRLFLAWLGAQRAFDSQTLRLFSAYFLFLQKKNVTGARGGNRTPTRKSSRDFKGVNPLFRNPPNNKGSPCILRGNRTLHIQRFVPIYTPL